MIYSSHHMKFLLPACAPLSSHFCLQNRIFGLQQECFCSMNSTVAKKSIWKTIVIWNIVTNTHLLIPQIKIHTDCCTACNSMISSSRENPIKKSQENTKMFLDKAGRSVYMAYIYMPYLPRRMLSAALNNFFWSRRSNLSSQSPANMTLKCAAMCCNRMLIS